MQFQKMCNPFKVIFHYYLYTFFLQTQWKDYENVKALMEILLYVIDNKLLEIYCQVIISIWVILYRCTWGYKNNGQLKQNQIEWYFELSTTFPLVAWTVLLVVIGMVLHTFQVLSFQISDTTVNGIVQLWRAILAHTLNLHYAQCGTNLLNN
jgi:uncharacterized membrane protein